MGTHHTLHVPKTIDAWKQEIKKAIEIIKLNPTTVTTVADDAKLLAPALIFILLGSLMMALRSYVFPVDYMGIVYRPSVAYVVYTTIFSAVMWGVGMVIISLVAQYMFKGKAKIAEYVRVAGYGSFLNVLGIIPFVGGLAALWSVVVSIFVLKHVHKLDVGATVGVILVSIVVMGVLFVVFSPLFAGLAGLFLF